MSEMIGCTFYLNTVRKLYAGVCDYICHGILFPGHTPVSYNKYYVSIKNSSTYIVP